MSSTVEASAKGASYLILVQVSSRALTFIINQILLRFLSPEVLGASTQLELYSIAVLYFARESFRVALQRQTSNPQAVVNISYLAIALGFPLAYLIAWTYSATILPDVACMDQSLKIYGVATIVELFTEPLFVVVQQLVVFKIRAVSETGATFIRCLSTFATVFWAYKKNVDLGVLPFAIGQLAYAVSLLVLYYAQTSPIAKRDRFSLLPTRINVKHSSDYIWSYFSRNLSSLSLNLYLQLAIKYLLTQGDGILIASMATLKEQGAFALASNYGGLIARTVFQPIEESSRNLFAKLCAPEESKEGPSNQGIIQAQTTLIGIFRFYNLLSLICCAVGPTVAPLLLQMVAGHRWADTGAGAVLSTYCYYIPLLAINGVAEAFVAAVSNNAQLRFQSMVMGVYSVVFGGAAYIFLRHLGWGATGLVYANCINMSLRIVGNIRFIQTFFQAKSLPFHLHSTYPNMWTIASGVGTGTVLAQFSRQHLKLADMNTSDFLQIAAAVGFFAITMILTEQAFLLQWYRYMFPHRNKPKKE